MEHALCPGLLENVPATQSTHTSDIQSRYVPGTQLKHAVSENDKNAYVPYGQSLTMQSVGLLNPNDAKNCPGLGVFKHAEMLHPSFISPPELDQYSPIAGMFSQYFAEHRSLQ
jgi:hypothetical protein